MIAPVEASVYGPVLGNFKGVNDVGKAPVPVVLGVIPKFLEKLSLVDIPPAIEPGLPELRRKLFQGPQVFRLALHQGLVVRAQGLDKGVVLRVLVLRVGPVDEQPLKIAVGRAAGV